MSQEKLFPIPWSKLNEVDVSHIKRDFLGGLSIGGLAKEHHVSHATIWQIVKGHQWKQVEAANVAI